MSTNRAGKVIFRCIAVETSGVGLLRRHHYHYLARQKPNYDLKLLHDEFGSITLHCLEKTL